MQLYHIVFANLRRRMAKMLFVLLGLSIGIATIVSVYGVVETMKTEMTRQVTEFGVNVVITPNTGGLTFSYGGITLPEILYDVEQLKTADVTALGELDSKEMIRVVAPKLLGLITHKEHKIVVNGANLQQEFTVKPWLRIYDGTMPQTPQGEGTGDKKMDFEYIDLTRQDLKRLDITNAQVLLGSALAATLDLQEGDILHLSGQEFQVVGVLALSGSAEDQQLMMNLSAAQQLLGRPDEVTVIEMAVDYFAGSEEALLADIEAALPHTQVASLRQETMRQDEMLQRLVRFGMSISVLVLLVGMLVVGLTMAASVRERTREIGVFRALGFRKSNIAKMIIMEGLVISIIGGGVGYLGGTIFARAAGPLFAGMDMQVPWRVDVLLIALALAVAIGLISSLYPAHLAAKQDPVDALRFI